MLVVYYPLSIREAAYALRGEFVSEFVRRGERWNKRVAQGTWSTEVVCPAMTSIESMPRVALLVKRFKWVIIIAAVLMAIVSTSLLLGVASPAMADPTDVGYRDFSFGTRASSPTAEKPQSKLWFNDGIWWGSLWNASTNRWEIYRFNWSAHTWSSTGTPLETRANSKADTLWDGTHLYVATAPRSTSSTDQNAYVRRYGYDAATKKYTLNSGFPAQVATGIMEAIVLDKDTTGKLWVTYAQGSKIYVNRSLGSDSTWGTPFVLPVPGTTVDPDDISALVSFDRQNAPPKIGVMWSNQVDNAMYFATHIDGDPDDVWQPPRVAIGGPNSRYADDHINLKSLQADSSGRVFAAVKTSLTLTSPDAPLTLLLALQQDNAWSSHVFGRVQDDHTRPMVLIDETHRELYMFATAPVSPGGTIYYKKTGLDNISFEQGLGTPFIKSSTDTTINNATSTKQNLNANTGLLVLASDDTSDNYLHNTIDLDSGVPPPPPPTSCTILGTSANDAISGTSADDVICAGGGSDTVKGLGGNDTLKGEDGNDQLLGGVGNDTLDGGLGTDTASYSASLTAVTASLATNSSTGEGSDTFLGVENLLGSSKADTLTGSATNNKLTGGGGPDTEQGGLGNDQVIGSGGADTLKGEDGDDTVNSKDGVNGNDSLDGGGGTDTKVTDATEFSIVNFP